jgi:hypothetical protein
MSEGRAISSVTFEELGEPPKIGEMKLCVITPCDRRHNKNPETMAI